MPRPDLNAIVMAAEPGPCVCRGAKRCEAHRQLEQEYVPSLVAYIGELERDRETFHAEVKRVREDMAGRAEMGGEQAAALVEQVNQLSAEVDQLRRSGGNIRDEYLSEVVRHNDAANSVGRVMVLAEEMEARAARILERDPVENGISAGEIYEAEAERAVAGRILAALAGEAAGEPGGRGQR
jgi:hypothetical protein